MQTSFSSAISISLSRGSLQTVFNVYQVFSQLDVPYNLCWKHSQEAKSTFGSFIAKFQQSPCSISACQPKHQESEIHFNSLRNQISFTLNHNILLSEEEEKLCVLLGWTFNMDEYCFKTSGFDILCVPLHTRRKKKETQIASPLLYAAETSQSLNKEANAEEGH